MPAQPDRSVKTGCDTIASVRIAAAQTPEFRDDVFAALAHLTTLVAEAEEAGAQLVCFPEGFLQGYLIDAASARQVAIDLASSEFETLLDQFPKTGPVIVFGMIESDGDRLYNTAVVIERGKLVGRYRKKHLLPGEKAFTPGTDTPLFTVGKMPFGISVCYDTNFPETTRAIADLGAMLIVCPTNNMMPRQRAEEFRDVHNAVRGERCRETGLWLISADVTGERDGRLAIGPTAVLDPQGKVAAQLLLGTPGLLVFDIPLTG
ncbi:putative amidohydrolase [Neorhizobium alkalisoli]|uniref:Putative amidohydrolase n=1 Tax=Neorhizobium alkalisoli TaxID=528178 RepID=A0A561R3A8_9HYPH|nr:putative amidohydrolase [Neorhizobium alkalisoli]